MKRNIWPKLGLGYALTTLLLLISGLAGLYGLARLNAAFDYLTGDGWHTANSSREGWLEIRTLI